MSVLVGWLIVLGLAIAIVCIFMLSSQLEDHMRTTAEMMLRSNQMLLEQLERITDASLKAPEAMIGVVLEKRHAQRRNPVVQMCEQSDELGRQRDLPRRRIEDLLQA